MNANSRTSLMVTVGIVSTMPIVAAAFQDDGQPTASSRSAVDARAELEEVVVTATKREERLQDVPFGISALTNEDLERIGAAGAQDYLAGVPGVHFTALGQGRGVPVIRGIASEGSNLNNLQRTVETYVDELPITDRYSVWTSPDIGTFDIARVEVMRGPQGTLFGSGALGGAVRLITNKPNMSQYQGKVELGLASTRNGADSNSVSFMANAPVVQDKLALRIVGYRREDGGYVDNVLRQDRNVDDAETEGARVMLQYNPSEAFNVLGTVLYQKDSVADGPATFMNGAYGAADTWNGVIPEESEAKLKIYSLSADYDFGAATLTSISTYSTRDSLLDTDLIRAITGIAGTGEDPDHNAAWIMWPSKRFAQEMRLASSNAGRIEWTIGAFYMDFEQEPYQLWDLDIGLPTHAIALENKQHVETSEAAVFGEATYHVSERVSITAGARWFDNKFGIDSDYSDRSLVQGDVPWTEVRSSATTPKVSVSYFPLQNVHLYVTAAKGYRIGQANFSANVSPLIPKGYDPDSLWNYEAGIKATWLEGRLRTNFAAYYIDWSDIQLQRFITVNNIPQNFTDNGGQATAKGIEAEVVLRPFGSVEIGSALNYSDAQLGSVLPGVPFVPGSRLPGSARFSTSNYVQGLARFNENVSAYLRLQHQYTSKAFSNINNSPSVESDAYNEFDLRAGIYFDRYELALYVNNLTDSDAAASRQISYGGTEGFAAFRLRPRTIGVTFRAGFE